MKNNTNQFNTGSLEFKKYSISLRIIAVVFVFLFLFTPLYKIAPEFIDCSCSKPEGLLSLISFHNRSFHPCGAYYH